MSQPEGLRTEGAATVATVWAAALIGEYWTRKTDSGYAIGEASTGVLHGLWHLPAHPNAVKVKAILSR